MIIITFTILICLQFIVVALHDWVNIPGWTHGRQVYAALGRNKMVAATLINGVFPGLAAAYALWYWGRPKPSFVLNYWIIYCAITVLGAITAWWIPYFRGTDPKTTELYKRMYAGTRHILPAHGDNPRPNVLHLYFHSLFLANMLLSVILRFGIES